ncbi:hypothetical protein [Amycolatopsis sp. PS_44_ISF1]|uniref:hypothetical protein n=1 Tax=Amycolatopsis sp. PS_44_ISF1 TaxID=2974917 RepID=UPI0028DE9BAC|nr:hypothetical protein [Amycolatopsis sp. PS_44_ISF1]MDT8913579.1 hypothetical protein [Amycolatopsis sp. PS_44_ISF1]
MSDEQHQQDRYGSRLAGMFGYVTPDDQARWAQQRAQNTPRVSAIRQAAQSSVDSALEFASMNVHARLDAAHRVVAQREFEESHARVIGTRRDPATRSIIETVDYEPRRGQTAVIEPDWEI